MIEFVNTDSAHFEELLDNKNFKLEVLTKDNELIVKITVFKPIKDSGTYHGVMTDLHKSTKLHSIFPNLQILLGHMGEQENLSLNIKKKNFSILDLSGKNKIFSIKLKKTENFKQLKVVSSRIQSQESWKDWIDEKCKNFEHVEIKGEKMKSKTKEFITLFGRIGLKNKFKFSIKFNKSFKEYDERQNLHKKEESIGINFAINEECNMDWINYSRSGQFTAPTFFGAFEQNFSKILKGDIVTMMGDRSKGIFELQINEKTLCKRIIVEFCDDINNNLFAPFISLRDSGSATLICNFPDITPLPIFLAEEMFSWDEDLMHELFTIVEIMNLGKIKKENNLKI